MGSPAWEKKALKLTCVRLLLGCQWLSSLGATYIILLTSFGQGLVLCYGLIVADPIVIEEVLLE